MLLQEANCTDNIILPGSRIDWSWSLYIATMVSVYLAYKTAAWSKVKLLPVVMMP